MKKMCLFMLFVLFPLIVFALPMGDVDGDGIVRTNDYLLIRKNVLKMIELKGNELNRADLNYDGKVSTIDYLLVRKIIMGIYTATPTPTPTSPPAKKTNPITVTASQSKSVTYSTSNQDIAFTAATQAQGNVTYTISSQKNSSGKAVTAFSIPTASTASVRMSAKTVPGTYTLVLKAKAEGNTNYNPGTKDITLKVTVSKANNPITVTASQSKSIVYSTSNKDITFTAATQAQGNVTYTISSQKNSSGKAVTAFSIPTASTASVRMSAKTAAGTYTLVLKAKAEGNTNYNSGTKDITFKVTVLPAGSNAFSPTGYITLSSTSMSVGVGKTIKFNITFTKATGTVKVTSSAKSIAKVLFPEDPDGIICNSSNLCFIDGFKGSDTITITVKGVAKGEAYINIESKDVEIVSGGKVTGSGKVGILVQ